jgi:hypothetical protein
MGSQMQLTLQDWLQVVNLLVLIVSVWITVWMYRRANNDKTVDSLRRADQSALQSIARLRQSQQQAASSFRERLSGLEATVKGLPTHKDLIDLQESISEIRADVSSIRTQGDLTAERVSAIHQHLLEQ